MYVRKNLGYLNFHGVTFTGIRILSSTSNIMMSDCNFSDIDTAINVYASAGLGGAGYDGSGKVILKDTNTFTNVTTAISVSDGSMLVQATIPTLNGAVLKKSNGGMIVYPNGTFSEN